MIRRAKFLVSLHKSSFNTVAAMFILSFPRLCAASGPDWWSAPSTKILDVSPINDWAPANTGQLKNVAEQAKEYLDNILSSVGGAGDQITEICQFSQDDNYSMLTVGQLKYVAKPFYDRLAQVNYNWQTRNFGAPASQLYPWLGTTNPENYSPVNIGQLKRVFSFDLNDSFSLDSDYDGMPNWWEIHFGLNPYNSSNKHLDLDQDGIDNFNEFIFGSSPSLKDTDGDGSPDKEEIQYGTNPSSRNSAPLMWEYVEQGYNGFFADTDVQPFFYENYWTRGPEENYYQGSVLGPIPGICLWDYYDEILPVVSQSLSSSTAIVRHIYDIAATEIVAYGSTGPGDEASAASVRRIYRLRGPAPKDGPKQYSFILIKELKKRGPTDIFDIITKSYEVFNLTIPQNQNVSGIHEVQPVLTTVLTQYPNYPHFNRNTLERLSFRIIPIDISIREAAHINNTRNVVLYKNTNLQVALSPVFFDEPDMFWSEITWQTRQLQLNGEYDEWKNWFPLGHGTSFTKGVSAGIFQLRALISNGGTHYYRRNENERKDNLTYGPGRVDQLDCFGVCSTHKQIALCKEAQSFYASTAYDGAKIQPAEYGFPEYPATGNSVNRCNIFVAHRATAVQAHVPKINGFFNEYPPLANEWAGIEATGSSNGATYIEDWELLDSNSKIEPGLIIAHPFEGDSGHCAITDYDGEGIGAGVSGTVNKNFYQFWDGTSRLRRYNPN